MPKIFINALSLRQGGGQTYLRNLLEHLPEDGGLEVHLLAPESFPSFPQKNVYRVPLKYKSENPLLRVLLEKFWIPSLLKELEIDVLFCPGGIIGVPASCKTVTTFHNSLPFVPRERKRYPLGYMRVRLWLLRFLQGRSFAKADLLIVLSEYAKSLVDIALPNRRGETVVIPHGLGAQFLSKEKRPRPGNVPQEYVLYVSTLDVYKAQLEVLEAWALLHRQRKTKEKLLLVGPGYPPYERQVRGWIAALELEEEVVLLGKVSYQELPAYYQHAKLNLFASSCENCPNILFEALAGARPLLSSNYPPMPEFGKDAVEYFDPYKPEQLADLLVKYLDSSILQEQAGQKARERAKTFSWQSAAAATWSKIAELG